jgi:predicted glycogen debranching enzyme
MASARSSARSQAGEAAADPAASSTGVEWLLTDGAGGYACGTAADLPTRRYHGLWTARGAGSARRHLIVAGLDERLVGPGQTFLMHAHWRSLPAPSAPQAQVSFVHRPLPRWTFRTADAVLERTVALQKTAGAAGPLLLVRWRNLGSRPQRLCVRPLLGWCDADKLVAVDPRFDGTVHARGASWGFRPDDSLPVLWLSADGIAGFRAEPAWYRDFLYAVDRDRGYDHVGNRWSPGVLELDLAAGGAATAAFSLEQPCEDPATAWEAVVAAATERARAASACDDVLRARLELGADDFLYRAGDWRVAGARRGVLAGFPWFGEWGRDDFIALPGLTLARGDLQACAEVLVGALPFLRRGLLPNIFGRSVADSSYGSCDAALWFALAVQRYAAAGGDRTLVREQLVAALVSIANAYMIGTDLGLAADAAGLLRAGRADLNATWMDAQIATGPVTPRAGQPVEIQALWYSLLAFLTAEAQPQYAQARDRCGASFVSGFWLADGAYLADRLHDGVADRTVRPNMVLAAALPLSPLSTAQRAGVVKKAREELVTPRGLRTLSPRDPAYQPRYEGGPHARDSAYHQGTVWPWLSGFYVEAALRAVPQDQLAAERKTLAAWLDGFLPELDRAGLDHVSEVFDAEEPRRPGGTFAQAWNTGELLRARALASGGEL